MAKNVIDVDRVTIRFNLASEKVNNLKQLNWRSTN